MKTETISFSVLGRGEDKKKQKGYKYTKEVKGREAHTEVKRTEEGMGTVRAEQRKKGIEGWRLISTTLRNSR